MSSIVTSRAGSSPRVRGKRWARTSNVPGRRAHPRVCGENVEAAIASYQRAGSSPRVRGKRSGLQRHLAQRRLIPARAGKTTGGRPPSGAPWAHPRVCGENFVRPADGSGGHGSSPRVRGKHGALRLHRDRLIPACAGKTVVATEACPSSRAHPRVCGENLTMGMYRLRPPGSSPRVRGKRWRCRGRSSPPRLIPACAGKTSSSPRTAGAPRAHPRVCGENTATESPCFAVGGSSPRVRGKRDQHVRHVPVPGLIPACAEKTPSARPGR